MLDFRSFSLPVNLALFAVIGELDSWVQTAFVMGWAGVLLVCFLLMLLWITRRQAHPRWQPKLDARDKADDAKAIGKESRMGRERVARIKPAVAAGLAALSGCSGNPQQSALHPGSSDAAAIAWLGWLMIAVFTLIFLLVLVLLIWAIARRPSTADAPPLGRQGFIISGGIVLPLLVLIPLYVLSLKTSAQIRSSAGKPTIRVVGHQWWWEVVYPETGIVTANEIYVPAGEEVRLELASADVIHSFWVPSLHGKRDLIPGIVNEFWLRTDKPGIYRGQCAEYCGTQHANMSFYVIALPRLEYESWSTGRLGPPRVAAGTVAEHGAQVFLEAGCSRCHTIRGTSAQGKAGPDLTHVGSRTSLGAGMIPNSRGNLAGWIADAPSLKPGVRMPKFFLPSDDLFALVEYLESLE